VLDINYPSRGVVMTYLGGDALFCPPGQARTMSLEIVCANVVGVPASYNQVSVREENTCSYRVQLPSIAGCPLECRAPADAAVCSAHGVCGYNTDASKSQCYCFDGYTGALCGAAAPKASMSTESILLIIVCIVLAGVLGVVAFMVIKLRRLNVNPGADNELQGKYNELGMMS
jgi:hypothetical protein